MGQIQALFGGEDHVFHVRVGELRRIQETCDAGPALIAQRLARCVAVVTNAKALDGGPPSLMDMVALGLGDWRVDDIRSPIKEALVGGGKSPNEAEALCKKHIDPRGFQGLIENSGLALRLVISGLELPEDADLGEPGAGTETAPPTLA